MENKQQKSVFTWFMLWTITITAIIVACGGLYVSYRATEQTEVYQQRCIALLEENRQLREQLANAQPVRKKVEMVFTVGTQEFAPKTLARQNRNLLNIRYFGGEKFKGAIGVDKFNHIIFSHPAYSVRAGAIILKVYEEKHGIDTIEAMIKRFAEGNRKEYTNFVCKSIGVKPRQKISLKKHMHKILPAMIKFETGETVGMEYIEIINAVRG